MHEVTNFPVKPQYSSLMFVTSRSLPYFHIIGFVFFFVSIYHFPLPPSLSPLHPFIPILFPIARQDRKRSSTHPLPSLTSPHFCSFHRLSEVLAALVRKSKSTVAYQSRSGFSSDRVDCWGDGDGGVLHDKQIWPAAEDMLRSRILRAPWTRSHEVASYLGAAFSYDEMDIKMLEPEYCVIID